MSQPSTPPPGICGPDVTAEVIAIWAKIQADFRGWTASQKSDACKRILIPLQMPTYSPGTDVKSFMRSAADINGWDVLPLFQGKSQWLRNYPIFDAATGGPCATPSSLDPSADDYDDAHESDQTCSDTVQVKGECWLNGTVNYGTFGIMVRLCHDEFPIKYAFAQQMAEGLIRAYKTIGAHPEGATLPIAWVRATFNGGPSGVPSNTGNRPQCKCTCPCKGSVTNWDYVWEPVKPRSSSTDPAITPKPAPPAPAPVVVPPAPGVKTIVVSPGDTLSNIAQKAYGNPSQWSKIYQANKAVIGPNPNLLKPGLTLIIP
jgi:LysM domain